MQKISYVRCRFPPVIIQHAVWLYFRFPLSYRDVEDLPAERGIDVSSETVRRWALKFGRAYARKLRKKRPGTDVRWHLDEVFVSINGKRMYLWRTVDCEGEVLDILVQSRRNKKAALKLMRKLLKKQGFVPDAFVTDKLPSYGAVLKDLKLARRHELGGRKNNHAENSHLDNGNDECSGSGHPDQHNEFCPLTPPSTTPLTSSVISYPERHYASFATMR
jgi:putative transposase